MYVIEFTTNFRYTPRTKNHCKWHLYVLAEHAVFIASATYDELY